MATGPDGKVITKQPTSPTAETEGFDNLLKTLQAMNVTPKADNPQELKQWMKDFLKSQGELEPDVKPPTQPILLQPSPLQPPPQLQPVVKDKPVTSSQPPRVNNFSGAGHKGETSYDLWRYEVRCLLKDPTYTKVMKDNAIRRSLRGEAGRVAMHLGIDASMEQILDKLDSIFGTVDNTEELMAEFYGARQKEDEDITSWSCRLEDIIGKGIEKGLVKQTEVNKMLHSMLWTGLRQELKDISGYKYETIKDFDTLRVALRQIEKEHPPQKSNTKSAKPNTSKAATSAEKSDIDELKGMVKQLTQKVTTLEEQGYTGYTQPYYNRGMRGNRMNRGGWNFRQPRQSTQQRPQQQQYSSQQTGWSSTQQDQQQDRNQDVQCRRCGQYGHIQIGCRVRMDHSRRNLNSRRPMPRGRS